MTSDLDFKVIVLFDGEYAVILCVVNVKCWDYSSVQCKISPWIYMLCHCIVPEFCSFNIL